MTLIHKLFECDATFPLLDVAEWRIEKKTDLCKGVVLADNKGVVLADHKGIYDFKIECIEYSKNHTL